MLDDQAPVTSQEPDGILDAVKPGMEIPISLVDLVRPWEGHIVTVQFPGHPPVEARISAVGARHAVLKILPRSKPSPIPPTSPRVDARDIGEVG